MPPQLIGQYELLGELGEGGMATVYRARDPRFGREVAIKVLDAKLARDAEVVERFKSEAIIQAKLNHPNIATVHDFIADGQTLAMVMEFVDGVTLAELIRSAPGGRLDAERAAKIMAQILSAVAIAHERGVVHRDLKPSNIMVRHFRSDEVAKVMDFGVAKILGAEKVRTATSAKIGTLAYMSPEHVRSPKSVDARSDIYSLGIVLYEMLTGDIPFDADSEYGLMMQIVNEPLRTSIIPGRFGPIVARATEKDPSHRFVSCDEFCEALRQPSASSWPSPSRQHSEQAGLRSGTTGVHREGTIRRPAVVLTAVVVLSFLVGIVAFSRRNENRPVPTTVTAAQALPPSPAVDASSATPLPTTRVFESAPRSAPMSSTSGGGYVVQVGAFGVEGNALRMRDRIVQLGHPAYVVHEELYRVRIGPFGTSAEASALLPALRREGLSGVVLRRGSATVRTDAEAGRQ